MLVCWCVCVSFALSVCAGDSGLAVNTTLTELSLASLKFGEKLYEPGTVTAAVRVSACSTVCQHGDSFEYSHSARDIETALCGATSQLFA
eukprot:3204256-Rhodomonas_salina.4